MIRARKKKKRNKVDYVSRSQKYPQLGSGLGLRPEHFDDVLDGKSQMSWFEVLTENYMGLPRFGQGPLLKKLLRLREKYPVVFHCVSINIGSTSDLDFHFLKELKSLKDIIEPAWFSDHLCWTGLEGQNTHELLPLPYTKEAVSHVASRIHQVQDFFGERFMIENTSSYVTYKSSEMSEWEFISEIIKRTDCGLLLDINNVYVSAENHQFSAKTFLDNIPFENVGQIHLAGHDRRANGLIVDTHDAPVCNEVYELVSYLASKKTLPSYMVEWDDNLPSLQTYEEQVLKINQVVKSSKGGQGGIEVYSK